MQSLILKLTKIKIRFFIYRFELLINNNINLSMTTSNKQSKYEKALEYEIFVKEEYGFAKERIRNAECIFDI